MFGRKVSVVPLESVHSSTIFGGLNQNVSVYSDHVVISSNSRASIPDTREIQFDQMAQVYLHTGVFYATLVLSTRGGYRLMVRWLPRRRAIRVAKLISKHVRSA